MVGIGQPRAGLGHYCNRRLQEKGNINLACFEYILYTFMEVFPFNDPQFISFDLFIIVDGVYTIYVHIDYRVSRYWVFHEKGTSATCVH